MQGEACRRGSVSVLQMRGAKCYRRPKRRDMFSGMYQGTANDNQKKTSATGYKLEECPSAESALG